MADLAGVQGRDGLVLTEVAAAPAPLTGMVSSTGEEGPIALAGSGAAWCVRVDAVPAPPPVPAAAADPAVAPPVESPSAVEPLPAEPSEDVASVPPAPSVPPVASAAPEVPSAPGAVFGVIDGPGLGEVASIVFLGPDNVLHEQLRVPPDDRGRFWASALPAGAYRIIAAGKGGRVLICEPPFIAIRVGGNGAVEAPVLKVLRAQ